MEFFFKSTAAKLYGLTIFISIVFFQVAYILLQWFYLRRKEYFYYAAYMLSSVIYVLGEFEPLLPFRLFTRIDANYHLHMRHAFPLISLFLYYRFARAFLNLPETRPELNKWVQPLEYFMLVYGILSPLLIITGVPPAFEESLFLIACTITAISSVFIISSFLRNSVPLTRFAMLGAGFLLLGAVITLVLLVLRSQDYDLPFDPYLPLLICVIAELLTFTTGLGFKTRLIEKQHLIAEHALLEELRERQKLESNMHQLRNKIAGNLHDDIGATLTSISIYSEVARKNVSDGKQQEASDYLNRIQEHSTEMQNNLRDILWVINTGDDRIRELWNKMNNYGKPFLAARSITSDFKIDEALLQQKLTVLQRRNLFLIFKEGVNNIIKHSRCDRVDLLFQKKDENTIAIAISDNGAGYDAGATTNGNGLKNMRTRTEELNGSFRIDSNHQGTYLKIEIPI